MAKISMELVKKLRDQTQVGMMDCKKALEEAQGDFEKAVEILRKKGAAVAAKRADNITNNGRIESFISADHKIGVLVQTACETDFSAKTDAMKDFIDRIAEHIFKKSPINTEELLSQSLAQNEKITVQQSLDELVSKICEKTQIADFVRFEIKTHGIVHAYIHPGSTVGVLIEIETDKSPEGNIDELKSLAKDLCMQVAVTNPLSVDSSQLDPKVIEKERNLATEQLREGGKPESIIEKIVSGKLNKFYQEVCLLSQNFIKDDKTTVKQHIDQASKKLGFSIIVKKFKRFAIGR
jgi:elongation factor Ts